MHNSIPTTRKHPRPRSRSRGHRPSRRGSVAEQLATLRLVHEHRAAWLALWLSERACAHRWGQVVRPDRYGRWRQGDREVGFFLEYDCGTEPLDRLAAKLHGYDELVDATEISTLVLFWLPSSGREASVRQALAGEPRWGRMRYPVAPPAPTSAAARPSRRGCRWTRPGHAAASSTSRTSTPGPLSLQDLSTDGPEEHRGHRRAHPRHCRAHRPRTGPRPRSPRPGRAAYGRSDDPRCQARQRCCQARPRGLLTANSGPPSRTESAYLPPRDPEMPNCLAIA